MENKAAYLWGLFAKFGPQGIYLVTTMVLARFLTPQDFGMIGVVAIIFNLANVLMDSGLGGSLIKEPKLKDIDYSTIFVFNLIASFVIYVSLFFSAPIIESFFCIVGLAKVVRILGLIFPATALGLVPNAILGRELKFKQIFGASIISVTFSSFVSIVYAVHYKDVYALVIYQVLCALLNSIICSILVKYKFSFAFSYVSIKRLLPFGIYTSLTSIVDTIYENLLSSLTGKYINVNQAGLLYQANRISDAFSTSIARTLSNVAFPLLTRLKDEKEKFIRESRSTLKLVLLFTSLPTVIIALFSKEIIVLLFGSAWIKAAYYLTVLMIAGNFLIAETLYRSYIKSLGKAKQLMNITLLKRFVGIFIIIISLVIDPEYMILGFLISSIVGLLINVVAYSCIIGVPMVREFFSSIVYMVPSFVCFFILKTPFFENMSFVYRVFLTVVFAAFIVLFVYPLFDISIIQYIKNKRNA